jgi:hypothetical protein
MVAPGAGNFEQDFEAMLRDISDAIERVQQLTIDLADRLDSIMRWLPGPIAAGMRVAWNRFLKVKDEIYDEVQEFVTEPGYPPALHRIGEYWDTRVGANVSGLQQAVSAHGVDGDNKWDGTAASAYGDAAEAQSRAVTAVKPLAEKIQNVLVDLSWGVIAFWVAMLAAWTTFVIGMVTALGLAAAVVTAPAAPPDAAATAAAVIALVTAAVAAFLTYIERIDKAMTTIQQALNDNGGLVQNGDTWGWPTVGGGVTSGTWRVRE